MLEVVKQLEQVLGVPAEIEWLPRQTGDVSRTWADTSAAREALGYAPATPFEEGVASFAEWLKEQR